MTTTPASALIAKVLVAASVVAAASLVLLAPAGAQSTTPTTPSQPVPCVPAGSFPVMDALVECPPPRSAPASARSAELGPAEDSDKPPSGMLGGITGEQVGRFPDDHYDLGYDEGAWNNFGAKLRGSFADMFFGISRFMASIGNWFIDFAYDLGFVKLLAPVAAKMAAAYNATVVGGIRLRYLALTLAVGYAAWVALRGRVAHGLGELGVSMVLAVLGALFVANPGGYLTGAFDSVGRFTQAVMVVGSDGGSGDRSVEAVVLPLRQRLQETLIAQPYDLLNWGALLDGTPCAPIRDEILATGPHGTSDKPREMMSSRQECERYAEWNHDATWERVGGAFLVMIGTFWVMALLVAVAGTVLLAQFTAAGIVAISPFAAVALILPAGARGLGWRLVTGFLGAMVAVVAMSILLAVGLRGLVAVLDVTEGGILPRFTLFLVMALALNMARKKFAQAGRSMAAKAGERLSSVRVAGAGGGAWVVPSTSSAAWALPGGAFMAAKARQSKAWAVDHHNQHRQHKEAAKTTGEEEVGDQEPRRPSYGQKVSKGSKIAGPGLDEAYGSAPLGNAMTRRSPPSGPHSGSGLSREPDLRPVGGAQPRGGGARPTAPKSGASRGVSAPETRMWPPPRRAAAHPRPGHSLASRPPTPVPKRPPPRP